MIGSKHVKHASDNCGGMLDKRTMDKIPCAMRGCGLMHSEHTSDKVMFLQLTADFKKDIAEESIKKVAAILEADGIDGIAFVESEFNFID